MAAPSSAQILNFIFELGMLKRITHEGWKVAGIKNPETVAEHSLRSAQIAFLLAKMEKYSPASEVVQMAVFHDIGETRIGDIHKIAIRYLEVNEEQAVCDQTAPLTDWGKEIFEQWHQTETRSSQAGRIAKDADLLEQAITAQEYIEQGYKYAQEWINAISGHLTTASAKILLKQLSKTDSHQWWQHLKVKGKK